MININVIKPEDCCRRPDEEEEDSNKNKPVMRQRSKNKKSAIEIFGVIALLLFSEAKAFLYHQLPSLDGANQAASRPSEYQLLGEAGQQIRLPCLIGKQIYCGEPYFIAWYKLNGTSKSWARFEHKSMEDNELDEPTAIGGGAGNSLADRVRFDWSPRQSLKLSATTKSPKSSICSDPAAIVSNNNNNNNNNQRPGGGANLDLSSGFDCAQLTISPLELSDEGQYKCEITFSESLDFDKCPATTLSQLNVIARPNEPELLVNGRKATGPTATNSGLAFKEGTQVKLECQSSGGKPAPRIEWLNVSDSEQQGERVHLMRDFWPQKRTSFLQDGAPVTASSLTVSLSRQDLRSQFVCLVLPPPQRNHPATHYSLEQLVENPAQLTRMLKTQTTSTGSSQLQNFGLMFRRIKLDVQVKPSGLSLIVSDVLASSQLEPFASSNEPLETSSQPLYSLQLNRLYAIQCLVEQSRPQSQVSWFNRSAPIAVEQLDLSTGNGSPYFIVPNDWAVDSSRQLMRPNYFLHQNNPSSRQQQHRISSFVKHELLPDGATFRTTATLLLTTTLWDNLEELSCQISNEAFQEEQEVPPSAQIRLFVNYAPFAWLEPDFGRVEQQQVEWLSPNLARLSSSVGQQLALRCSVAANPLGQNTILQIEWLKDGRKIQQQQSQVSSLMTSPANKQQAQRVHIERANHLHMPQAAAAVTATTASGRGRAENLKPSNQLASGSKLIGSSWLTIQSPLNKLQDSGNYTCQFKLIPAPPSSAASASTHPNYQAPASSRPAQSSGNEIRITSGQANQTIQVNVVEAIPSAPTIGIASARGVFVYWLASKDEQEQQHQQEDSRRRQITAVVDSLDTQLSLSCEMSPPNQLGGSHKILWYADGKLLQQPQSSRETIQASLRSLRGGAVQITCAHQMLTDSAPGASSFHAASSVRLFESANAIDIRLKVGPKILERREMLMPQMRSFSELELSANPTNKVRLICLAQCEPLCSIEWYLSSLSEEPLAHTQQQQEPIIHSSAIASNNQSLILQRHELLTMAKLPWFRLASAENILPVRGGKRFSWLKQTSLGAAATPTSQQQLDSIGGQLLREAGEQQYLMSEQANVFSRLELSYNSIARLLEATKRTGSSSSSEINIKCRINQIFDASNFEHLYLPPNQWFRPNDQRIVGKSHTNLSSLFPSAPSDESTIDRRLSFVDELQTSIVLDKAPASVSIYFAGFISSSDDSELNGVTLSESQLMELTDPNRMAPMLQCKTGGPQAAMKYKWTFVDWNNTELSLDNHQDTLNLRQLIELRQNQLNVGPVSALGLDVVLSSIVGNYTCTASNIHGSRSATMPIRLQGRPICKLSLANEFLGPENELIANLRCSIYSLVPLIEVAWSRSEQQFAANRSATTTPARRWPNSHIISWSDLPVMVLNKHQEFLLTDLVLSGGNFKCLARNALGLSDPCELSQVNKQLLLNTLRPFESSSAAGKNPPPMSMVLFPESNRVGLLANQTVNQADIGDRAASANGALLARFSNLLRIDWLVIICCLLAGLWLLFLFSSARRKFKLHGSNSSTRNERAANGWPRFSGDSSTRSNSNNEIGTGASVPFAGSKVCVNYYGGSNNDSEHEMIQSGSQSSHYEDFIQHQLQLKQQQQQQRLVSQPLYLNGSTLNGRPMKFSLSSSSTCDSSNNSRPGAKKLLNNSQTALRPDHIHHLQQQQQHTVKAAGGFSNVPLVNGSTHISRVNLDHLNQIGAGHYNQLRPSQHHQQQLYGNNHVRNAEHIYDDVIYNQMIL